MARRQRLDRMFTKQRRRVRASSRIKKIIKKSPVFTDGFTKTSRNDDESNKQILDLSVYVFFFQRDIFSFYFFFFIVFFYMFSSHFLFFFFCPRPVPRTITPFVCIISSDPRAIVSVCHCVSMTIRRLRWRTSVAYRSPRAILYIGRFSSSLPCFGPWHVPNPCFSS